MRATESRRSVRLGAVIAGLAALGAVAPAGATTLIRASLEDLTDRNSTVVLGRVLEARSYWNGDATFILTEVRVQAQETLKGDPGTGEFTVTLMGGTVGDRTVLIVGGAGLVPGKSYVLFLDEEDLPGAVAVRTVRDHCQGVFEVVATAQGARAVSQANNLTLLPDGRGVSAPPGGAQGLALETLLEQVRERAGTGRR